MRTKKRFCIKCQKRLKKGRTILCTSCLLKELKNGKDKENSQEKSSSKKEKEMINQETQSPFEEETEETEPEVKEPEEIETEEENIE